MTVQRHPLASDIAGQINTLLQIGKKEGDDEMIELAQRLSRSGCQ